MISRFRLPCSIVRTMSAAVRGSSGNGVLKKSGIKKQPEEVTKEEWKGMLDSQQYKVTREASTELPFTGQFDKHWEKGGYNCICCGASLFESESKFDSGCGWPAFHTAKGAQGNDEGNTNIARLDDDSEGMKRIEVRCKKCNAHLGHVFNDGPKPTGERFCINSVALDFAKGK